MDLTPEGDQVSGVYIVTNPAKLTHVRPDRENEETAIVHGDSATGKHS